MKKTEQTCYQTHARKGNPQQTFSTRESTRASQPTCPPPHHARTQTNKLHEPPRIQAGPDPQPPALINIFPAPQTPSAIAPNPRRSPTRALFLKTYTISSHGGGGQREVGNASALRKKRHCRGLVSPLSNPCQSTGKFAEVSQAREAGALWVCFSLNLSLYRFGPGDGLQSRLVHSDCENPDFKGAPHSIHWQVFRELRCARTIIQHCGLTARADTDATCH